MFPDNPLTALLAQKAAKTKATTKEDNGSSGARKCTHMFRCATQPLHPSMNLLITVKAGREGKSKRVPTPLRPEATAVSQRTPSRNGLQTGAASGKQQQQSFLGRLGVCVSGRLIFLLFCVGSWPRVWDYLCARVCCDVCKPRSIRIIACVFCLFSFFSSSCTFAIRGTGAKKYSIAGRGVCT